MTHGFDEDFMGGILVAADALFQRTNGKRYQREIILFTDAQSKTHFITDLGAVLFSRLPPIKFLQR